MTQATQLARVYECETRTILSIYSLDSPEVGIAIGGINHGRTKRVLAGHQGESRDSGEIAQPDLDHSAGGRVSAGGMI